jgi:hypothetical protein
MRLTRRLRRRLAGRAGVPEPGRRAVAIVARQRAAFDAAYVLVTVFYATLVFVVVAEIRLLEPWSAERAIAPLWPVAWLHLTGTAIGVPAVVLFALAAALAAAALPGARLARVLCFLGLLEVAAVRNSFGKINHGSHAWIACAFLFTLLPSGPKERVAGSIALRQRFLTVFFGVQCQVAAFYSMSGLWKVTEGALQWAAGEIGSFAPEALPRHVALRLLETASTSFLGSWLIPHPLAVWPLYLGTMYLELFSFVAAFRPRVHRLWGVMLMAFHVGTMLAMTIDFSRNVLLVGLLFVASPFAPPGLGVPGTLAALPLAGLIARWPPFTARLRVS